MSFVKNVSTILQGLAAAVFLWITFTPSHPAGTDPAGTGMTPRAWAEIALGGSVLLSAIASLIAPKLTGARINGSPLYIDWAHWGIGNWLWEYRRITKRVRESVRDGKLDIPATIQYLGDPFPGVAKQLTVRCFVNGTPMTFIKAEGERLVIPEGASVAGYPPTPEAFGRLTAAATSMHDWKGRAEGCAEELKHAHSEYRELSSTSTALTKELTSKVELLTTENKKRSSESYLRFWQWIGKVEQAADDAEWLKEELERQEYEWTKEKEVLLYPLSSSIMPDVDKPLSWRLRDLLGFRRLYRQHLETVTDIDKNFTSLVTQLGFPLDGRDCLTIKKMLDVHASLLRQHAQENIKEHGMVSKASDASGAL